MTPYSATHDRRRNTLSSLTGEFTRSAQEAEFRADAWSDWHTRTRVVVLTGTVAFFITLYVDYLLLGSGLAFGMSAAARLLVAAYGLAFITVAARLRSPTFSDGGLLLFLLLLITVFLAMIAVRPDGLRYSGPACVLILCVFYALPMSRLWITLLNAGYLSVGMLAVAAWVGQYPTRELVIIGVQLVGINLIGIFIALRMHHEARRGWMSQRTLELRERHQRLLAQVSTQFLGLRADQVDTAIQQALRAIVEHTDSDRAYLMSFSPDQSVAYKTHEWCGQQMPPVQLNADTHACALAPWTLFRLQRGEIVQVDHISDLPPEASVERSQCEAQAIQAFLCVPLAHDSLLLGMIGIDRLRQPRPWQPEVIELLRFVGQSSFNALRRAHAEQNLKEREAQFQALATQSPAGLFQADADGYFLYVNDRWSQLAGQARELALGDRWMQSLHAEDSQRVQTRWQASITGKEPFEAEFRIRRMDGRIAWMHCQASPQLGEQGQLLGFIGTWDDITERKHAQDELMQRSRLDELMANLTMQFLRSEDEDMEAMVSSALSGAGSFTGADRCGFFLFDLDSGTMSCRYQWSRGNDKPADLGLVGLPIDQFSWATQRLLRGEVVHVPAVEDMPPEALQERSKLIQNGVKSLLTVPVLSGGKVLGYVSLSAVREKIHWTTHTTLLLRFIGEMIVNTLQRQESRDAQAGHVHDLERLNQKLEQHNIDLQKLAYVASHDLQEPLRAVSGFSSLLQQKYRGQLDEQADEYIGYITHSASRLNQLLDGLLAFIEIDREIRSLAPCDLNTCARAAIDSLVRQIKTLHAKISCGPLPILCGEPSRVAQLLRLLIANALKFHGHERPRISITARDDDSAWIISVADNGTGIPAEHAERVFELFQTLHPKDALEGTGIGLAICRRIVELHGGRIWVEPNPGGGSVFSFSLPKVTHKPILVAGHPAVHHAA